MALMDHELEVLRWKAGERPKPDLPEEMIDSALTQLRTEAFGLVDAAGEVTKRGREYLGRPGINER